MNGESTLQSLIVVTPEQLRAIVREAVRDVLAERVAGDDLISLRDAAAMSGRGERTLREDIRTGRLRGYRAGRAIRVRRSDVMELVETHVRAPVEPTDNMDDDDAIAARKGLRCAP